MNLLRNQKIIIGAVGGVVLIFVIIIITGIGLRPARRDVTLTVWGIDYPASFEEANERFTEEFPGVKIDYTQIPEANYEANLINALAAGQGPDIFVFRSDWIRKHGDKIVSAPEEILSVSEFISLFPQVAAQDFILNNEIYASPLFIDTLALYYNKDIFDRRDIAIPPDTWSSFRTAIARGVPASFGGYAPLVARSGDIMNALLMQAGADLSLQNKSFVRLTGAPGVTALNLYLSVRAPRVETYAGFANETLGMIIDYQSAQDAIAARNPLLNFGIAPLPQLKQLNKDDAVVPARYYGFAVSDKSLSQALAWEYVSFITTNAAIAEDYLIASGRPPALRSLIQAYLNSPTHGVFAGQALIARSWNMPASEEVFAAFNAMIRSALGRTGVRSALQEAENAINDLAHLNQ